MTAFHDNFLPTWYSAVLCDQVSFVALNVVHCILVFDLGLLLNKGRD